MDKLRRSGGDIFSEAYASMAALRSAAVAADVPMKHRQIGRYQIKAELKRGGMSTIYLAHDPLFERDVAIKLMPAEMMEKPTLRARFDREAKIIASLDHPAIVPVYDLGVKNGQPYLVLRFMTGGSLEEMLQLGPLTLAEAARILERLAAALDEVHHQGIVHRDLKPSNILFDHRHNPFIADFGIVRLNTADVRLTNTGDAIGTPAYMSPEQIRGDRVLDGRSDIYALGVLLFEMLSGTHPFDTPTPMGIAVKHITAPVPPIRDLQPGLPPGIEAVLDKAMAKKPEERFQMATEMAEAVQALLTEPHTTIPTTSQRPEAPATIILSDTASASDPASSSGKSQGMMVVTQPPVILEGRLRPPPKLAALFRARPRYAWFLLAGILLLLLVRGGFALAGGLTEEPAPTTKPLLVQIASPTTTPTATATATLRPTQTATASPTATATLTRRPTTTPTMPTATTPMTITAINAAAYFVGPDTTYSQLETFAEAGEVVMVLAQSESGHWLLVENSAGVQGWAARSYFAEQVGLNMLPVSEGILGEAEPLATAAANQSFVTWSVVATSPAASGTWQTDLLVTVPAGGSYQFQVADLAISAQLQSTKTGLSVYRVTVSGMNCVGPLVADLQVTRNGAPLEVRNASSGLVQPVFVSPPEC